jgi:bifunctional UDP-N-acetylglucosamine pyrophosphorylase/glucosamine-1-phosphate N-acetyltransferase
MENDRDHGALARAAEEDAAAQDRLRVTALGAGVNMIAPETVRLSADTVFGRDVVIEPFVVIGAGVSIGDGARICSFSYIAGAEIGRNASVGPYARLRPGTQIGEKAKVGNFVEIKAARLEAGAKVNHLSYIGDATIGAGTITCNYDGFSKHRTIVGTGAFVGSNTSLVAPVKVGDGAVIGAGSVIVAEVPPDAMVIERAPASVREGGAARFRASRAEAKAVAKLAAADAPAVVPREKVASGA